MEIQVRRKLVFWFVKLVAKNGRTRLVSEMYYSKSNAVRAAKRLALDMKAKVNIQGE